MRSALHALAAALLLIAATGCTHMSPAECKQADWYALGVQDGRAGEALDTLDQRRRACVEAGAAVDARAYLAGRDRGLQTYCHPANALELGLKGRSYHDVCPPEQATQFRRRYDLGREVYQAHSHLDELQRRSERLEERLRKAGSDDERSRIRRELRDVDGQMRGARVRVNDAEAAVERLR